MFTREENDPRQLKSFHSCFKQWKERTYPLSIDWNAIMTMDEAFSYDGKSVDDEMVAVGSDESNDDEELSGHEI